MYLSRSNNTYMDNIQVNYITSVSLSIMLMEEQFSIQPRTHALEATLLIETLTIYGKNAYLYDERHFSIVFFV